ncbi:MAG: HD domain-containing protein [Coriobacteriales bacterium]|nr:HD domain-containing protein [Coriobacteriales bacterium]
MVSMYYALSLLLSLALMLCYFVIWHKHFDTHITLIFALVPVANLGSALVASAQSLETALAATKVTYIGGCYLILILMLAVFSLCDIELRRWLRVGLISLSTAVYVSVLTIGRSPVYYKDVTLKTFGGTTVLEKTYGPLHSVFIAMVVAYFCVTLGTVVYSYAKKNQVSHKNLSLLFLTEVVAMVCFFGGRKIIPNVELLPVSYNFALVVYLFIAYRLSLYDISGSAIDTLTKADDTGFVSFDYKFNYLGSNEAARTVFPQLGELVVDRPLSASEEPGKTMLPWLERFAADGDAQIPPYQRGDKYYMVGLKCLYSGKRKRGYQLVFIDDTKNQNDISMLSSDNSLLQREVARQTAHIVEMHDNLVMSMAMMVESRDNSTGGHIRRTSEGVRLLIAEMKRAGVDALSESFCRCVIKAAPMHDLGKIAVDDAVLRKPGRFTAEEFNKMKAHAAEGARIVHEILAGTDDEEFKRIAENVAHYHHERWDGSGYPEGLSGEDIPLEARIMAIADVYDALVSKRVYKEAMSFEEADAIIMDGMGTQFDRGLEPYYVAARPQLERYYAGLEQAA